MATGTHPLTLPEFERLYAHQDTAYEYWFGEAVLKPMTTSLHGIVQSIVVALLRAAGYYPGTEVDLHISNNWQPRPDIVVSREKLERPYPTKPVHFVVEIRSDESDAFIRTKCRNYLTIGQRTIYYLDPGERTGGVWSEEEDALVPVDGFPLLDGSLLPSSRIWEVVDREL